MKSLRKNRSSCLSKLEVKSKRSTGEENEQLEKLTEEKNRTRGVAFGDKVGEKIAEADNEVVF